MSVLHCAETESDSGDDRAGSSDMGCGGSEDWGRAGGRDGRDDRGSPVTFNRAGGKGVFGAGSRGRGGDEADESGRGKAGSPSQGRGGRGGSGTLARVGAGGSGQAVRGAADTGRGGEGAKKLLVSPTANAEEEVVLVETAVSERLIHPKRSPRQNQ